MRVLGVLRALDSVFTGCFLMCEVAVCLGVGWDSLCYEVWLFFFSLLVTLQQIWDWRACSLHMCVMLTDSLSCQVHRAKGDSLGVRPEEDLKVGK